MKLKITSPMAAKIRADLRKAIALPGVDERLAIVYARFASEVTQTVVVAAYYAMLPDNAYVAGPDAANFDVRWLMQMAQGADRRNCGLLLTHLHEHKGRPWFSPADLWTVREVLYSLYRASPRFPQGALLFSSDAAVALIASAGGFVAVRDVSIVP